MIRHSYIKHNSHTQQQAAKEVDSVKALCIRMQISEEEWLTNLFEYGCRFIELCMSSEKLQKEQLQDPRQNFWAIWMHNYIRNDKEILSCFTNLTYAMYIKCKEDLINPEEILGINLKPVLKKSNFE